MAEDADRRSFAAVSALAELRLLAGLLKPRLAPLLDPGVAGQHPTPLELRAERRIDVAERPSDAVSDRRRLSRDAASVHPDADVDAALIAGLRERLLGDRLEIGAREVLVELALVDLDAAAAWPQDHASDRRLALARRRVGRVARELGGLRGDRGGLLDVADQLTLAAESLLLLRLAAGALLGVELPLGLDRDRIELGA